MKAFWKGLKEVFRPFSFGEMFWESVGWMVGYVLIIFSLTFLGLVAIYWAIK